MQLAIDAFGPISSKVPIAKRLANAKASEKVPIAIIILYILNLSFVYKKCKHYIK